MEGIADNLTTNLVKAFKEFILGVDFPESVNNKLIRLKNNSIFLNFNYTDTLEKYYFVNSKRVLYVHGKAKIQVLGANVSAIVTMLSKDFMKPVLIAIVIASPIAGYLMNKWLQDYAYRIHTSWWIYALAAVVALFIATITVSSRAIRVAMANPIESLRSE
jgi:hypothetical protein